MSLREAVKSIATDLEDTAKEHPDASVRLLMKSFAKQLSTVLVATENEPQVVSNGFDLFGTKYKGPGCFICQGKDTERCPSCSKSLRQEREDGVKQDAVEPIMVDVVGDPDALGVFTQYPITLPPKGVKSPKVMIAGKVFVYEPDNKLHYNAAATEAFRKAQAEVFTKAQAALKIETE